MLECEFDDMGWINDTTILIFKDQSIHFLNFILMQIILANYSGKPISHQKRRTAARVSVVILFRSSVV